MGLFPANLNFYRTFDQFYLAHMKTLDCLGLFFNLMSPSRKIVAFYDLQCKLIDYRDQLPDRSCPSNDENCYLPYLRNKRVLIICPFAEVLKERATQEIYEGVWSEIGKHWFYPQNVEALEFPYGFAKATQNKYATVLDLYDEITEEIQKRDFDIALIGAAGLAIPIASYVKSMGKVGLDLGGHLQIIFGVLGKRWRSKGNWRERYFNKWWIDMPARYKPQETDVCDAGAFW
jgi:hypothetical protein